MVIKLTMRTGKCHFLFPPCEKWVLTETCCQCCSWDPIVKYIKDQHSAYLRKELTAMRDRYIQDTRIHCCLYFINPTGHSLRPIDVIVMKKLSEVVNVVPVIAKADSLTLEERESFKQKVGTVSNGVDGGIGADVVDRRTSDPSRAVSS